MNMEIANKDYKWIKKILLQSMIKVNLEDMEIHQNENKKNIGVFSAFSITYIIILVYIALIIKVAPLIRIFLLTLNLIIFIFILGFLATKIKSMKILISLKIDIKKERK